MELITLVDISVMTGLLSVKQMNVIKALMSLYVLVSHHQ